MLFLRIRNSYRAHLPFKDTYLAQPHCSSYKHTVRSTVPIKGSRVLRKVRPDKGLGIVI